MSHGPRIAFDNVWFPNSVKKFACSSIHSAKRFGHLLVVKDDKWSRTDSLLACLLPTNSNEQKCELERMRIGVHETADEETAESMELDDRWSEILSCAANYSSSSDCYYKNMSAEGVPCDLSDDMQVVVHQKLDDPVQVLPYRVESL